VTNKIPKDDDVTFLICELARQDLGEKLSLLGIFVGSEIKIDGTGGVPTVPMPAIALVFLVDGGDGVFDSAIEVIGPDGSALGKLPMKVQLKNGYRGAVVAQLYGFPLSGGTFTARLDLEGTKFERTFRVLFS
jgi:hypothetical protein